MDRLKTRYVLRRADGCFFKHPDDTDIREWTSDPFIAHRWVDFEAAQAAAYIWHHLKGEDVRVVDAVLSDRTQYFEVG